MDRGRFLRCRVKLHLIFVATASASRSDGSFSSGGIGVVVRISKVKSLHLAPFLKHDGFRANETSYTYPP